MLLEIDPLEISDNNIEIALKITGSLDNETDLLKDMNKYGKVKSITFLHNEIQPEDIKILNATLPTYLEPVFTI